MAEKAVRADFLEVVGFLHVVRGIYNELDNH